jgi:hypothetical protein
MSTALSASPTADRAAAELLARILYAEVAHRGLRAVEALAALAANRARAALASEAARERFAAGEMARSQARMLIAICRAPFQFPVRHPRHARHARFTDPTEGDPALAMCRRVALRAVGGALPDATGGALLWHDEVRLPDWALGRLPVAEIGGLVFYWG